MQSKQQRLKNCLSDNQYIIPSYQLYGGLSGFQDYGILGTRVKNKLLNQWRKFFLEKDEIYEIETPVIMPYNILKASGHVDRFTDFVVYDTEKNCHRADHLAKKWFKEQKMLDLADQVDSWDQETLEKNINHYKMISGTPLKVQRKNLMFEVSCSLNEENMDFLRPEIAGAMFVNFKTVHQFLQKNPPFGIAQTGYSFRKEISPKQFTRMRSFSQAEIEYFCDPLHKVHPQYEKVQYQVIPLLTQEMQKNNTMKVYYLTLEQAMDLKLISHKLMAYFLVKIFQFAKLIGLQDDKLRFRQHMPHEMAHYAIECWDLEVLVHDEWLECVGCADRGSFDLQAHSSNTPLTVRKQLEKPIIQKQLKAKLNFKVIRELFGTSYGEKIPILINYFDQLTQDELIEIKLQLFKEMKYSFKINENTYELTENMIKIEEEVTKILYEDYYPHVIEPSFGIDRLMYAIFEQNFWVRENNNNKKSDDKRIVLSLPSNLVPYEIAIFQLYLRDDMLQVVQNIKETLMDAGFLCFVDYSNTQIGKRYSRIDEMGIKYAITVDPQTINDQQVTIRERDSMRQIRVPIKSLSECLHDPQFE
jgi:glycyl-tRNA synthetase